MDYKILTLSVIITLILTFIGYVVWLWTNRAMIWRHTIIYPVCKWYDFWIGFYYDQSKNILYFFPIPMMGIAFNFGKRKQSLEVK